MEAQQLVKRLTGDYLVYPGHPLVVATVIMSVFDTNQEAAFPAPNEWCQALGDQRVPGSGCHVSAAMNCLRSIHEGATLEEEYWP